MPIWSLDEMRVIAPLYCQSDDWLKLYEILGGIPRTVFERPISVEQADNSLRNGSCRCDFARVKMITDDPESLVNLDDMDQVHRLIHIHSSLPFNDARVKFASDRAVYHMYEKHLKSVADYWKLMVSTDLSDDLCGSLVGKFFELHALTILEKGADLNCVRLYHGGRRQSLPELLHIPRSHRVRCHRVSKTDAYHVLHVPILRTFAGIDAWISGIGGFQVTINNSHGISPRIKESLPIISAGANKLFWVLRQREFASFNARQPRVATLNHPELEQYAVEIPDALLEEYVEKLKESPSSPGQSIG